MWLKVKDRRINFELITEYRVEGNEIELEGLGYEEEIEFKNEEDAQEAAKMMDDYLEVVMNLQMFFSRH
jgi:hypothetical protein